MATRLPGATCKAQSAFCPSENPFLPYFVVFCPSLARILYSLASFFDTETSLSSSLSLLLTYVISFIHGPGCPSDQ